LAAGESAYVLTSSGLINTRAMSIPQRVLDQNQKIQALTVGMMGNEATSPTPTPTAATPAHRVLTPSRSIRSNLDQQLPTTPTPKEKTGTSKSLLKSPGSPGFWHYNHGQTGSPRPIPMHEGMKSNASARKGRRLTVENDLERLRGGSHEESRGYVLVDTNDTEC
jgi:hypothetical protein